NGIPPIKYARSRNCHVTTHTALPSKEKLNRFNTNQEFPILEMYGADFLESSQVSQPAASEAAKED
ncbi:hypothetical protein U1Q18_034191, partial [Sarracenia purpurea var. burkii]